MRKQLKVLWLVLVVGLVLAGCVADKDPEEKVQNDVNGTIQCGLDISLEQFTHDFEVLSETIAEGKVKLKGLKFEAKTASGDTYKGDLVHEGFNQWVTISVSVNKNGKLERVGLVGDDDNGQAFISGVLILSTLTGGTDSPEIVKELSEMAENQEIVGIEWKGLKYAFGGWTSKLYSLWSFEITRIK